MVCSYVFNVFSSRMRTNTIILDGRENSDPLAATKLLRSYELRYVLMYFVAVRGSKINVHKNSDQKSSLDAV